MKVNEIKTKKGVDLLQHLVDYYQAQHKYVRYNSHKYVKTMYIRYKYV